MSTKKVVYFPGLAPSDQLLDYGPGFFPSREYTARQISEARKCLANAGRVPKKRFDKRDHEIGADSEGRIKPGVNCTALRDYRLARARLILSLSAQDLKWYLHHETCQMQTPLAREIESRKPKK